MSQPWRTALLLFSAFWTFIGAHGTHAALRARRSLARLGARGVRTRGEVANSPRRVGTSYHPPQIRYQAPPLGHPAAPTTQTYRQVPLNCDSPNALYRGTPVILRYDPEDPRRAVVIRTAKSYSPTANLVWCVFSMAFGIGLGVLSLL
ncbi:hypothetical protein GCM10010503_09810 [Streptomyces lucensis JCM 4490]|uniref:DUF3592 domain-containing protein n=1 Tax=Streptomyces lucensis JCM 4490 TaxID=1306176 RepID=A0A918IWY8_9ACTN|nr:DUF3592 domain-containing protein [Streptomyces lucensis]GGW36009.1 hypothetical protein GCM10010503_09810 [Streptomyces lucensis JCM 4490]